MTQAPSGRDRFDPATFTVVDPRTFEDLEIGDIFRAPSRTLTDVREELPCVRPSTQLSRSLRQYLVHDLR